MAAPSQCLSENLRVSGCSWRIQPNPHDHSSRGNTRFPSSGIHRPHESFSEKMKCGPVSRILYFPPKREQQPLIWMLDHSSILASYPKDSRRTGMAGDQFLLLGIAPAGVYPCSPSPRNSVSSYLTFSPLPTHIQRLFMTANGCGWAVSFLRHYPSLHPDASRSRIFHTSSHAPNMGGLPCGVRTFLPGIPRRLPGPHFKKR